MPVPAAKQRALLAALLLRANRVVSVEHLAAALWGGDLSPSARTGVQNYVMRLRKALGPAASRISTRARGYLIRVEPGELDLDRFEDLLREARAAARDARWPYAADQAAAALALWRGEPLADLGSELLTAEDGPRLAELRPQALETRIDADLHLGRHGEVIAELRQLIAEHPLRERLHGLLMLALYRDGQLAEALAAYQHARQLLVDELGAEPGPDLQQLHQQILTADRALVLPNTAVRASKPAAPVPRELPGDVGAFTGRIAELAELDRLLLGQADQTGEAKPTAAVISAVSGTAGVGKTALAVHWAHHAAEHFPDGQLHVNLRGYDHDQPVAATDALAGFLRSLGVAGQDIPPEETERSSRYRSLLADKRMLVVLDNAATVDQVRPLLPGTPACTVLVTSRDSLAGLIARDGAKRLDLDLLPLADAIALLRELIGSRVGSELDATATLAEQCARLPLALRVAAELATTRPNIPLAELVAELSDQQQRLDVLSGGGDPRTAVRAVFSWTYDQLDHDTARTFRLIGLNPGHDFDPYAAAALTDAGVDQIRKELGTLIRAHLIQSTTPGRYGMHDLLRAYAREQAARCDGSDSCEQALTRLFDYYLAAAADAMDTLYPAKDSRRARFARAVAGWPTTPGKADPQAWLDGERANLTAVVVHCANNGWLRHANDLADALYRYLIDASHLPEAQTIYIHALQAARRSGDRAAEATALTGLAGIGIMNGRFRDAAGHSQAALERYRQCGDRLGEARMLFNLGIIEVELHDPRSAICYHRQAIAAYEDAGHKVGVARSLSALATAETDEGCYDAAEEHLRRALPVLREGRHQQGVAETLGRLGDVSLGRGQLAQAAVFYNQALVMYRTIDYPTGVATELFNLGEVSLRQGEYHQAISYLQQALDRYRQTSYKHGQTLALRSLAKALHAVGQPTAARAELAEALRLSAETGNTYQRASVHRELADSHHAAGDLALAQEHWQRAQLLYAELGAPEADEVRARLATLSKSTGIGPR